MKWAYLASIAWLLAGPQLGNAETSATQKGESFERIGVYDSRAVAVAFAGSAVHNQQIAALRAERDKAKAAGDTKRVAEIEAQGSAAQVLMHKQGFSTAPVDNILVHIQDALPDLKKKAGVSDIVSKWDNEKLAKHRSASTVDVTMDLVDAFHPNERQRKSAIELQKHKPIPLEKAAAIKD